MARHTGPVCRLCRREGVKLFLKGSRCDTPKCAIERRGTPPGMQQARRGKMTDYGMHLRESKRLSTTTACWSVSSGITSDEAERCAAIRARR